jgi:2-keto-3-deoxy-L-rhamnonate aldolase RhmA
VLTSDLPRDIKIADFDLDLSFSAILAWNGNWIEAVHSTHCYVIFRSIQAMRLSGTIGTWTSLASPAVAEIAAGGGFDFVVVDTEHTPLGLEAVANNLRAIETGDKHSIVRVPWNDPVRIKRLLDLGPDGLLVPMINSEEEAQAAVAATRYPPDGIRGVAAARAAEYGRSLDEYVHNDHRDLLTIAQVETRASVESSDRIAAVEGIDALLVGPADLSASLDVFGEWSADEFVTSVETVIQAGNVAGIPVGTLGTNPEQIRTLGSIGFDFMIAGVDFAHLIQGQQRAYDAARELM